MVDKQTASSRSYVVPLSASGPGPLAEYADRLARWAADRSGEGRDSPATMERLAYTLQTGREPLGERLALVVSSLGELAERLAAFAADPGGDHDAARGSVAADAPGDAEAPGDGPGEPAAVEPRELARLWAGGADVDWRQLYGDGPGPARLSLPAAPLSPRQYWLAEPDPAAPGQGSAAASAPRPLAAAPVGDAEGPEFATTFTGDEFFLRDHAIGEMKILPAVAALELAVATAAGTGRGTVRTVSDVLWARPVVVTDRPVRVRLRLTPTADGLSYEVRRGGEDGGADRTGELCSAGRIGFARADDLADESPVLDLAGIRARCPRTVTGAECYALFDRLGGGYGPSFQPLRSLVHGEAEALARVEVPEAAGLPLDRFTLHPSLLDGMLQAALWTADDPEATRERKLPFSLGSLEILRPLPRRGYVHAVPAPASGSASPGRDTGHDLTLTDDEGRIALRLRGLVTRAVGRTHALGTAGTEGPEAETLAFEEVWEPSPAAANGTADADPGPDPVLVVGFGDRSVAAPGGTALAVLPGDTFAETGDGGWRLRLDDEDHWERLFARLAAEGRGPAAVVWDAAALPADDGSPDRALPLLSGLFRAWSRARTGRPVRLLYVYETTGGLDDVHAAALDGLAKAVANEQPDFLMSVVSVPPGSAGERARIAARELAADRHAFAVRHRNGERHVRRWRPIADFPRFPGAHIGRPALREDGTYLVTGGLGGLGRILVRHLAARGGRARFVLTGRSPLDGQRERELAALRADGIDAVYRPARLGEPGAAQALTEWIRAEFGALHGVLHLAGVTDDAHLLRKSAADMAAVLAPKVPGTVDLDRATADQPLDFFVLFSSVSGAAGSPGQSDYAYANRFLDGFAGWREELRHAGRRSGRTLSLLWSLWEDGGIRMGMDAAAQDRMVDEAGLRALPSAEGLAAFDAAFGHDGDHVLIARGRPEKVRGLLADAGDRALPRPVASAPAPGGAEPVSELVSGQLPGADDGSERAEGFLRGVLAEVFGMAAEEIEPETAFEAYGIDSILVMDLTGRLEEHFGPLPKTLFFEYQDLRSLTGYFTARHAGTLAALAPAPERAAVPEPATAVRAVPEPAASESAAPEPTAGQDEPIAIVGVSARFAGSDDLDSFWENLRAGRNLITEIPAERWDWRDYDDATEADRAVPYSRWGSFIDGIDRFDPLFFGMSPREAEIIDPQERLFLQTAWHTLEDAGYTRAALRSGRVGVYVGAMYALYQLYEGHDGRIAASSYASIANRVSHVMGFQGPSLTVDSMCSSALSAIHLAIRDLRSGEAEVALAGGVNLHVHPYKYRFLGQGQFTSGDGLCRSFGEGGDGYVPGEGVGAVLLKPLSRALRDGDHVYATILGSALGHGGKTNGFTVPNPLAQGDLIGRAVERAGVAPGSISYIEAHGTGTALGDPIEIRGLTLAFEGAGLPPGSVPIGSVKSNIGHLESAAGMAALCKVLLQMRHRTLVPSLHSDTLNPNIEWAEAPFAVQRELTPWHPAGGSGVLRAGISSFGAGGANAHLVVEEHRPDRPRASGEGPWVFPFSAKTPERLREVARRFAGFLARHPEADVAAVAHTLQVGREALADRLAVVASSVDRLAAALTAFAEGGPLPGGVWQGSVRGASRDGGARVSRDEVRQAVERRDAAAVAALWADGGAPEWRLMYDAGAEPGRLPLPGYPFEEMRCWITGGDTLVAGHRTDAAPAGAVAPHPLLDRVDPAESLDGALAFAARFGPDHPLIRDHQVGGVRLLPGVAVLEMARAAAGEAGLGERAVLRAVRWLRPLTVDGQERPAWLSLRRTGRGTGFELRGRDGAAPVVFAQGAVEPLPDGTEDGDDERVSLDAIRERCGRRHDGARLYADFAAAGLVYGPVLRGVEWIAEGDGEALARLAVPAAAGATPADCVLHPALLDSALQTFAVLRDRTSGQAMVPYAVEAVEIRRRPAERGYAHVRTAGPDRYDIALLDDDGRVCVRLRDLALRPAPAPERDVPGDATARYDGSDQLGEVLFAPRWVVLDDEDGPAAPAADGVVWIVHDEGSEPLARQLADHGPGRPLLVRADGGELPDLDASVLPHTLYFLSGTARPGERHDSPADLEDGQQRGVLALFRLVKTLLAHGAAAGALRLAVVTEDVCAVEPDGSGHPVNNPFAGGLHGLAMSLAQEYPRWRVTVVDRASEDDPRASARTLVRLAAGPAASRPASPLALRADSVYRRKLVPVPPAPVERGRLRRGGVYLLLGGAGGIGLEMTDWLVREFGAKVVLVGRSALDERRRERLRRIDPDGRSVSYERADAGDPAELERVVRDTVRTHGALHGVVHSTIVLRDKSVANMDEATFRAALDAKTKVGVALMAAVRELPLDFVLFFSSAVALSGSAGQSNYAAGSTFEDSFAHFLGSRLDAAVRVVNWGFWGTVGIVAEDRYRERLARSGIFSITPAEGMAAVDHLLGHHERQLLVTKASREVLESAGVDFADTGGGDASAAARAGAFAIVDELAARPPVDRLLTQEVSAHLDRVMLDWLWLLFRENGVFRTPDERWTEEELAGRLGVRPGQRRLFAELLRVLTVHGGLREEGGALTVTGRRPAADPEAELTGLCDRHDALNRFDRLLGPCMRNLFPVLRGEVRATDVMFPGGSTALVEGAYRGSPVVDRANDLVISAGARYLAERARSGDGGRPLSVLEVGAGTGGTTAVVLPELARLGEDLRYVYTDISMAFLQHGRERFGAQYPFVEFRKLDAGRDPGDQGFEPGGFDVVIAANVLHATDDLLATLERVRSLLRPGGWLVLNEASQNVITTTLTFGLLDGWWLNKDAHLRLPGSPLLSGEGWERALAMAGFARSRAVPADEGHTQCVVIAERGSGAAPEPVTPAAVSGTAAVAAPTAPGPARPGGTGDALRQAVETFVKRPFAEILQVPEDRLFPEETFENFGIDSLTTPRIVDRLAAATGGSLPATLLFEYSTIGRLVDYFLEHHAEALRAELLPEARHEPEPAPRSEPVRVIEPAPRGEPASGTGPASGPLTGGIAIVGVAGRYPKARDLDAFWDNLGAGRDCVGEVPENRWDWREHTRIDGAPISRWGGFLDGIDEFDPRFFQMSRNEAELTDPQERLFLQTAWHTLEDAGYPRARLRGATVGVYVGVMYGHYQLYETEDGLAGSMGYSSIANRVSYFFDFQGPSLAVDTMCSSSLSAIHLACEALLLGNADYALAGGVNLAVHPRKYGLLAAGGFTSTDGRCRSFGEGGDGMVPGEGVGAVLLKPLEHAERDGDRIHGVILGSALNHGGKTSGYSVPNPVAQGELVSQALRRAGTGPGTVSYIEAHGTGTALGDPTEMAGLVRAFGGRPDGAPKIALGSLKSAVGHLESAAGVAALTKVLLQMRHRELVPSLHAERLNSKIDWAGVPFEVQRTRAAWRTDDGPLRAGISAFGAGGSNAHLVLEEPPEPAEAVGGRSGPRLFVLSARDQDRLRAVAADLHAFLGASSYENGDEYGSEHGNESEYAAELARLAGVAGATQDEPLADLGLDLMAVLDLVRRVADRYGLDAGRVRPETLHTQMTLGQVASALAGPAEPAAPTRRPAAAAAVDLDRLAWTLQAGREAMGERLALVASGVHELCDALRRFAQGDEHVPGVHRGRVRGETWLRPTLLPVDAAASAAELDRLARRWADGEEFDWAGLYPSPPRPMSLPGYPFARERTWIAARSTARADDPARPVAPAGPTTAAAGPPSRLGERVLELLSGLTGFDAAELDPELTFHAHGLDSLSLIKLADQVSRDFGVTVTPDLFLEATTPAALTAHLWRESAEEPAGDRQPEPATAPRPAPADDDPVVIVGMAGTLPESPDLNAFWANLERGGDLVSEVPADRWDWRAVHGDPAEAPDRTRVNRGGFMPGIDRFDPLFFGISPREAAWMDPRQRLLLTTVWTAIEDAGIDPGALAGTRTGLFVGVGASEYAELVQRSGAKVDAYASTGLTPSMLANRVSYHLDLRGPSEPVDTACSSSLVALHRAAEALELGHCDTVIAGGVSVLLSPVGFASLERAGMLSPDGVGRAFDKDASGYVRGEGVGAVVLMRLSKALADGHPVHAVLRGTAVGHGGRANSLTAPNPPAQAEVIVAAHRKADVDPRSIGYIETHGTGTVIGDPAEVGGLRQAFATLYERAGHPAPEEPHCALAALKNVIGHLEPAAGIAALVRAVLSLRHRRLPGNPNVRQLNGYLRLDGSPFHVPLDSAPWPRPRGADGQELPRRAGISSFGYGGVNAHVVLEEYVDQEPPAEPGPAVFALSARDPERLRAYARAFVSAPVASPESSESSVADWAGDLTGTAWTLQTGRPALAERLAFVAHDGEEARARLRDWLAGRGDGVLTGRVARDATPPVLDGPEETDPHAVAAAWVEGAAVDWRRLYRTPPRRRSLPTYPFATERYWFPAPDRIADAAAEPAAPAPGPAPGQSDGPLLPDDLLLFGTAWRRAPVPAAAPAYDGTTLVLCADDGALADRLPGTTVVVRPGTAFRRVGERGYEIHPSRPESYVQLLRALHERGLRVGRIAHLWPLLGDTPDQRSAHGPAALFLLLKAVLTVDAGALERVQVATGEHGDAALAEAWGGFAGSLMAIAPGTDYSVVRFAGPYDAGALLAELTAERLDAGMVRHDGGVRFTQHQRELPPAERRPGTASPALRDRGVYLISGGLGGLGRLLARTLATRHRARLALLGRSPLDAAGRARLEELRALGAEADYFRGDVADAARMSEVVTEIGARWGRLHGVFHLAGTVSGQPLPDKDLTELHAQLRPRVDGTRALDEATRDQPLDLFVLYASTSGHLGDFGLVDYAVGARYLDGFAAEREGLRALGRRSGRTVALDWPMWREGGMHVEADDEERYLATTGFRYLETDEGERVLDLALSGGMDRLMAIPGDPERIRAHVRAAESGERGARRRVPVPAPPAPAASVAAAPTDAALRTAAVAELRRMLSGVLDMPADALEADAGFGEYGLDSFGLKTFSHELGEVYGIDVPTTTLFSANTIAKLGDHLVAEFGAELRAVHAPAPAAPTASPSEAADETAADVTDVIAPAAPAVVSAPEQRAADEPIAIVGMSGRFPGSPDLDAFWENLAQGRDLISETPAERWDWRELAERFPGTPRWGGFLEDVDRFDPLFFKISPLEAEVMDPQHRLFLEETWKALEDAGCRPDTLAGRPVCVFVGTQFTDYESMVLGSGEPNAYAGAGLARTMLANRISYLFDLRGPSESVDTACSSSLVALHRAVRSLRSGESELAIAGGVSLVLSPQTVVSAQQLGVLAPDGRCKTMDSRADGYVKGEGVAALVLKPLSRALADGDRVHGVIRGSAVNHGGHATSLTAPNPDAQADLLTAAYRDARLPVGTVSYVEMHGTGTELGDPVEVDAIRTAWRRSANERSAAGEPVAGDATEVGLGTVKSNIGHLEPAAGVAGVVKVLLAMRHRRLPATLHVERLNPLIRVDGTPFAPVLAARDWRPVDADGTPLRRRAGVSSFGFGGVNAHVVLEEAAEAPRWSEQDERDDGPQLFVLSARNPDRLRAYAAATAAFLARETDGAPLAALARTSRSGRVPMAARLAVVAASRADLGESLAEFAASGDTSKARGAFSGTVRTADGPQHAWLAEPEGREYLTRMVRDRHLDRVAELWVAGADIDWSVLPADAPGPRASLPVYPFARERHWLGGREPAAARPQAPAAGPPGPDELLLAKRWRADTAAPGAGTAVLPAGEPVLVLTTPANETLAREAFGTDAVVVTLSADEDADPGAGDALVRRVLAEGARVGTVVDLVDVSGGPGGPGGPDEPDGQGRESWARVVLAQELVARFRTTGLTYLHLTHGLTTFRAERPTLRGAAFAGLVRMLPAEYRGVRARTVDLDARALDARALRAAVAAELAADPGDPESCHREGVRHLPVLEPVEPDPTATDWRDGLRGRPVLITGGTGALGRAIAADLIARGADTLVLMGRRPLPERMRWEELCADPDTDPELTARLRPLLALERPGVRVDVVCGALDDPAWLRSTLAAVRARSGPIAGVVHCAGLGLTANPAFVGKSVDEMRTVLEPKVAGLRELSAALADDPLRFFVLSSSVSAEAPVLAAGISDYALANSFLDRFAAYQAATGRDCFRSLQWPSWRSMGMPEVTTDAYRDLGLRTLPADAGLALLHRALAVPGHPVLMPCLVDPERYDADRLLKLPVPAAPAPAAPVQAAPVQGAPAAAVVPDAPGASYDALLSLLTGIFSRQLRLAESELDPDAGFADLGVDSIMIAQLLAEVERGVGTTVEPSAFLEHPTLRALSAHLLAEGATVPEPAAAEPVAERPVAVSEPAAAEPAKAEPGATGKIAVIGLACHFPGAPDQEAYWRNLAAGTGSVTEVPASRWDVDRFYSADHRPGRSISKWGGFLDGIEDFDPEYFRMAEAEAPRLDPLVRQFLEVSAECLHDAGIEQAEVAGRRVGVFAGSRTSNFGQYHAASGGSISGMAQNFIAAHVSHFLNVRGPNMVVDSACSSSLVSVHLAAQSLRSGECEMALAGGVEILLDQIPFVGMSEGRALSPTGRCHTFDEKADGIVLGEGAGVLLLKRLDDALRDGDRIHAVIDGSAVNNDGRTMGITTPNPEAQREVISEALRVAGVDAGTVSYVEAHGTGTMIGDPMELKALTAVFRETTEEADFCGVGSVKTNVGHLLSAAGIAGLIKVILSIRHGQLPPTLNCERANPRFRFDESPFYPVRRLTEWRGRNGVRRAGVSSFGFGGTNAHMILSGLDPALRTRHPERRTPLGPVRYRRRRFWFDAPGTAVGAASGSAETAATPAGRAAPFFELRFPEDDS
ncbi:SDR family NAD(P)-dependent oxidoreductase [Streptomyces sp. NPDC021212]|uniref:SDR family NAD(P)-dependent oxidoreductase n=1 Tax=Streptomyces sp. NPDC021212 TaxID=3365118 RepID=UPI00378BBB88